MAIELARRINVDETLEMGFYVDDHTDPWVQPDTIILVPGCRKLRQLYYAWIPTLARHFRVIRPHLRGHWDSTPAPDGYLWTVDGLILDIKNFLDALGIDRAHYVGESSGGILGYHFAYHYPERLKTLTLVTSPGPSYKRHAKDHPYFQQLHSKEAPPPWGVDETWRATLIDEFGPENIALAEWYNSERWKVSEAATNGYFKAICDCEVNVEEFLPQINTPVLMMMGAEHDRVVTVPETRRLCSLMPRAKLVTFPGVTAQCQSTLPERCAQEVVRFIQEQNNDARPSLGKL